MGLGRQAKVLDSRQLAALLRHVATTREPARDRAIVLLAFKAGLRAKEIGGLRWRMVTDADEQLGTAIALEDVASKGRSGRVIPLHASLGVALEALRTASEAGHDDLVVRFRKGSRALGIRSAAVQALFRQWFDALGFAGASSHSGRRTFITAAARQQKHVRGASLRDVQALAGHSSLNVTQGYIDRDAEAQRELVKLV